MQSPLCTLPKSVDDKDLGKVFLQFCIVGLDRMILGGNEKPLISMGSNQPPQILDTYPLENHILVDTITDFCFPQGVFLDLVDASVANALCRCENDKMHVAQFSDMRGVATYACFITIYDRLVPQNSDIINNILNMKREILKQNTAANIIKRFFRGVIFYKLTHHRPIVGIDEHDNPRKKPLKLSETLGYFRQSFIDGVKSLRSGTPSPNLNHGTTSRRNSTTSQLNETRWKVEHSGSSRSEGTLIDSCLIDDIDTIVVENGVGVDDDTLFLNCTDDSSSASAGSEDTTGSSYGSALVDPVLSRRRQDHAPKSKPAINVERVPGHGKLNSGSSSGTSVVRSLVRNKSSPFDKAVAPTASDDVLVTQRCFCMISAQPLHAFMFEVLRTVVERERMRDDSDYAPSDMDCSEKGIPRGPYPYLCLNGYDSKLVVNRGARESFLSSVQLQTGVPRLILSVNTGYETIARLAPTPNAPTIDECSLAILLAVVPVPTIVRMLGLLLLERSLIVLGNDMGVVSAIATAAKCLLSPFPWEGIFVPSLPPSAAEVMEAPVPFIVGTLTASRDRTLRSRKAFTSGSAGLLRINLPVASRSPSSSGSPVGKDVEVEFEVPPSSVTSADSDVALDTLLDGSVHSSLLAALRDTKVSRMRALWSAAIREGAVFGIGFVMSQLEQYPEIRVNIKAIRILFRRHNTALCGDIAVGDGWRKYGAFNASTGDYTFYPDWFVNPLRMRFRYQEKVVRTQLFNSFVDKTRTQYLRHEPARLFIRQWLGFRLFLRKKRGTRL